MQCYPQAIEPSIARLARPPVDNAWITCGGICLRSAKLSQPIVDTSHERIRTNYRSHTQGLSRVDLNKISGNIIDAAICVHSALGPGLMERAYRLCLFHELSERGVLVRQEVPLPVRYKEALIELGYRIDLLVEECVVVELKAVDLIHPVHKAQLFTYLKLSGKPLGLLLNFNSKLLKHGIVRIINSPSPRTHIPPHSECPECSVVASPPLSPFACYNPSNTHIQRQPFENHSRCV